MQLNPFCYSTYFARWAIDQALKFEAKSSSLWAQLSGLDQRASVVVGDGSCQDEI